MGCYDDRVGMRSFFIFLLLVYKVYKERKKGAAFLLCLPLMNNLLFVWWSRSGSSSGSLAWLGGLVWFGLVSCLVLFFNLLSFSCC